MCRAEKGVGCVSCEWCAKEDEDDGEDGGCEGESQGYGEESRL